MNTERLLAHFERVADAPDAVARLRRFILDLAVRGKLVPQYRSQDSVSELLTRIAAEKSRREDSGELRQTRNRDEGALRKPFEVPDTWRWVRLDTVGAIVAGGTPPATDSSNFAEPGEGIPWLTPADLGASKLLYVSRGARDLSSKGLQASSATLMPAGTVLFTSRAPIGYVAIAENPLATNQGFKSIVPYLDDCSRYIATAMRAFAPQIDADAPGTTFKEVSAKIVAGIAFPLPPLTEQSRIVARVDELMAVCDRLEQAREREAKRDRLTMACFARLNTPDPDAARFANDARFALDILPTLTARRDQIRHLRQTILSLAFGGFLTKPAEGDGTGADLLRAIKNETERYGGSRSRRLSASERTAEVDRPLFSIPAHWCWAHLEALCTQIGDIDHKMPKAVASGVPFLSAKDLKDDGTLDFSNPKHISEADYLRLSRKIQPARGDIVYSRIGARLGKARLVEVDTKFLISYSCCLIRPKHQFEVPRVCRRAVSVS